MQKTVITIVISFAAAFAAASWMYTADTEPKAAVATTDFPTVFAFFTAAPHGADRMDDMPSRQLVAASDFGVPGLAPVKHPAFVYQFRPGRSIRPIESRLRNRT